MIYRIVMYSFILTLCSNSYTAEKKNNIASSSSSSLPPRHPASIPTTRLIKIQPASLPSHNPSSTASTTPCPILSCPDSPVLASLPLLQELTALPLTTPTKENLNKALECTAIARTTIDKALSTSPSHGIERSLFNDIVAGHHSGSLFDDLDYEDMIAYRNTMLANFIADPRCNDPKKDPHRVARLITAAHKHMADSGINTAMKTMHEAWLALLDNSSKSDYEAIRKFLKAHYVESLTDILYT